MTTVAERTALMSQDAEDFIDAMFTLNPTIGTYVLECMERDHSKEAIKSMWAAFDTAAKTARGWAIGRFGDY